MSGDFLFYRNLGDLEVPDRVSQGLQKLAEEFSVCVDPTPDDVTYYWFKRLNLLASRVPGFKPKIPPCNWSRDEIERLRLQEERLIVLLPEMTLPRLALMHPDLKDNWAVKNGSGIKSNLHYGYLAVEDTVMSPNPGTTEGDLAKIAKTTGRYGMTLETYIVASMECFDRTRRYLDHEAVTSSRLPGSLCRGDVLTACFFANQLSVVPLRRPDLCYRNLGGRFERTKK